MTNWHSNPISTAISQEYMNDHDYDIHSLSPETDQKIFKSILPPFETAPKDVKSRIPSLEVELSLERDTFVTNSSVEGKLKLTCYKEGICKLGRIMVYLIGIEENLTAKKSKPRLFLSKHWILQDLHLVPSDSVYAGTPDEHGMWKAKYGTMTYNFSIPFNLQSEEHSYNIKTEVLPIHPLPSSYWHEKAGGIRYFVAGVVESKQGMVPREPLAAYKLVHVYESVPLSLVNCYDLNDRSVVSVEKTELIPNGLFGLGKKLKLTAKASVCTRTAQDDNASGAVESGSACFLHLDIKNETVKRLSARTIRNSNLIDISYNIAVLIWIGNKKLEIDVPISIFHPTSFLKDVPPAKRILKSSLDIVSEEVSELLGRKSPPLLEDRAVIRPSEVTLKDNADERKPGINNE
ncbi:hypothetical protein HK103_006343 [Boothiomyces macroporosus]|uniref:Arrestin C-terminal-like domain-containing protein n=1 Tax=Boothiomyces macroporosus TaxID=261099 RepID=A0AAD5UDT0_9FUNG|nr:hypothetical protein HK103_006343 [Boothiomyces macroporosus]